jgi:hypothetical protein
METAVSAGRLRSFPPMRAESQEARILDETEAVGEPWSTREEENR